METNTETKQISSYVSGKLGLPLSSQQIRNLINFRLGSSTTEDRLKQLITEFAAYEGNCLLVQNELGLTCGIVVQNSAQAAVFQRWGENLVLDWTHNTNNLGFYLGSLIVTVPSGRGVSVLDFLCVNQQTETLKAVMEYFKANNPAWELIQSVVIDKDFAEINALKIVFPRVNILLCQFHAIRYIRRMLGSATNFVPLRHRAEVEDLFSQLLYAPTKELYTVRLGMFTLRVKQISKGFYAYFQRNWETCAAMWCNFGRRDRFFAGNTTTNRIESNWNQFKQLLGKKSSIDKCLRVVFQQQVCVLRQFANSLSLFDLRAPLGPSIPSALRPLGGVLSDYCFRRVRRQWERHLVRGKDWQWNHMELGQGDSYSLRSPIESEIKVMWRADGQCSCDCVFFASTWLPCQHIFNVMSAQRNQHEFEVAQLSSRWSMIDALSVSPALSTTIRQLTDVRRRRGFGDDLHPPIRFGEPRRCSVGYVKLRRGERCDAVVLSDCEKFNVVNSELLPLIDAMQKLPSHVFYEQFADLRATIAKFKTKWGMKDGSPPLDDDSDDDALTVNSSVGDEDDLTEEVDLWVRGGYEDDMELHAPDDEVVDQDSTGFGDHGASNALQASVSEFYIDDVSQVTLPDITVSSQSQELMREIDLRQSSPNSDTPVLGEVAQLRGVGNQALSPKHQCGSVVVVNLPPAASMTSRESRRKGGRVGIVNGETDCPIALDNFLMWINHTPEILRVVEVIHKYPVLYQERFLLSREPVIHRKPSSIRQFVYPFVIPRSLVITLNAALIEWSRIEGASHIIDRKTGATVPVHEVDQVVGI